eukprot:3088-Heterococcus_DN1.PRE.3
MTPGSCSNSMGAASAWSATAETLQSYIAGVQTLLSQHKARLKQTAAIVSAYLGTAAADSSAGIKKASVLPAATNARH